MNAKVPTLCVMMVALAGCTAGGIKFGTTDANDARSQCAAQQAQQRMSPEQEQRFMRACMAGYGYGPNSTEAKPFTVKMPGHDQKQP